MRNILFLYLILIFFLGYSCTSHKQPEAHKKEKTVKIKASDGAPWDYFGFQVALEGERAIVSARMDDDKGKNSGSIYVYEKGIPGHIAKLTADDGGPGDLLGDARILIKNTSTVMAGVWASNVFGRYSGALYIWEEIEGVWSQTHKLTPSDGHVEDIFGVSFDWEPSTNNLLIGAFLHNDVADNIGVVYVNSGVVYVFKKIGDQWIESGKLQASDVVAHNGFGRRVDIYGTTAVIGAFEEGPYIQSDTGAAYVFEYINDSWVEVAKLVSSGGDMYDSFGRLAKIHGDTIIVGAPDEENGKGAVYVFEKVEGVWTEVAKLLASDGEQGDTFGKSAAVWGDRISVALRFDDDKGNDSGSVYIFEKTDGVWTETFKLRAYDGSAGDQFGKRIDMTDRYLIVGAFLDDDRGVNSGSAYIYEDETP